MMSPPALRCTNWVKAWSISSLFLASKISSVGGISTPKIFAVCRLRMNSNFVDCSTGDGKHNRNRAGGRFGGERRRGGKRRCDHRHLTLHQIGSECGKAVVAFLGPAIFDDDVVTLEVAGFRQSLAKCHEMLPARLR